MGPFTPTTQDTTVYTLAAQMMAAAASDADRARIDKALDLVETVERTATPGLFLVGSQSCPNGAYRVRDGLCCCPDAANRDARRCKHAVAVELFKQAERLDAEQSDPTPDPDAPIALELTGRAYLALVPAAALPNPVGTITVQPTPAHLVKLMAETFGGDAA